MTAKDEEQLREVLKTSIEEYRYRHSDVWRGQQFYTTLNTSIIGAAVALIRIGAGADKVVTAFLFGIGFVASVFGFHTIKRLRRYFLESQAYVALIEKLLGYDSPREVEGVNRTLLLPFTEPLHKEGHVFKCRDLWVEGTIYRKWGVTYYFLCLQVFFAAINLLGFPLVLSGVI